MYLIRLFEESCGENYSKGFIRGFLHLYIGQEAVAVGSIDTLQEKDLVVLSQGLMGIQANTSVSIQGKIFNFWRRRLNVFGFQGSCQK